MVTFDVLTAKRLAAPLDLLTETRINAMLIRTFRNDDLLTLHRLWGEHWSISGIPCQISVRQFEQAILSRLYFDPKDLLVAVVDGKTVGWCQRSRLTSNPQQLVIPSLVVGEAIGGVTRSEVFGGLLQSAMADQEANSSSVQLGVGDDWIHGYGGVDPLGPGVGVVDADRELSAVAERFGFTPSSRFVWMEAAVSDFRFPMNRDFMQLRRITQTRYSVAHVREVRRSQAYSHLDPKRVALFEGGGFERCHLNFFLSDQHAEVMQPHRCLVLLDQKMQRDGMSSDALYLLACLVRDAASHQLHFVDLTIQCDGEGLVIDQLRSLQFDQTRAGAVWSKGVVS